MRAFVTNLAAGGVAQGGSTITQQYVKMVQIEDAKKKGDEDAVEARRTAPTARKIRELRYAIAVEKKLTKDQILEKYLNIAYFGDGRLRDRGRGRALLRHHGGQAHPRPGRDAGGRWCRTRTPSTPWATAARRSNRRNVVLNRMAELGIVSSAQAGKAKRSDFNPTR